MQLKSVDCPPFIFLLLSLIHTSTHFYTMTNNTLRANLYLESYIAINCLAPEAVGEHIVLRDNTSHYYGCSLTCTLKNQKPQLEFTLLLSSSPSLEYVCRLHCILSLRVVSRDGTLVHTAPVNGVSKGAPLKGRRACCFKAVLKIKTTKTICLD